MKKVILISSIAICIFSSCKKDYTWECSVSSNGVSVTSNDLKYQIKNSTEDDATNECEKWVHMLKEQWELNIRMI